MVILIIKESIDWTNKSAQAFRPRCLTGYAGVMPAMINKVCRRRACDAI